MASLVKLQEIATIFNGKTPSKAEQRAEGHPVLKIRDVNEAGAFKGTFGSFIDEPLARRYRDKWTCVGDTMILNAAHNADYVGSKTFFAGNDVVNTLPTGEWLVIRAREELALSEYVNFWLRSASTRSAIRFLVKGIHLYPKDVATLDIPLPPLDEQLRICDVLSRAEGIVRLRREAQMKSAELIPSIFIDLFGDPARNPKGWPVMQFEQIADTQLGKMLDKKKQTGTNSRPYLGNSNVRWGAFELSNLLQMDFSENEQVKFELLDGDLLVCEGGEVGRAAIWRGQMRGCFYQKALHRVRVRPSLATSDFVLWWLASMSRAGRLSDAGAKATIAHLPAINLRALKVAIPPISLQNNFTKLAQSIDQVTALQNEAMSRSFATFDALLNQAFAA